MNLWQKINVFSHSPINPSLLTNVFHCASVSISICRDSSAPLFLDITFDNDIAAAVLCDQENENIH